MTMGSITLRWEVGFTRQADSVPEKFVPALVPGAVQLDWARANGIPFPEYAGNTADYRWMEDVFWLYRARLDDLNYGPDEDAFFVCGGVDYRFQVRLGGLLVHEQEGMFTPFEVPLPRDLSSGNLLEILIFPAPKSFPSPDDRAQANRSAKPAVSYGWDFHPRLIPAGIWEDARIEIRSRCHLTEAETLTTVNDEFDRGFLNLTARLSRPSTGSLVWQVFDPDGHPVLTQTCSAEQAEIALHAVIDQPKLWWPNGHGDHPLYISRLDLLDANGRVSDRRESRVGFRRIRLVKNPQSFTDATQDEYPRGPMIVPITFEVNGKPIFTKGSNWVSPDIFPGRITSETYRPLLEAASAANLNILRCWGGAIVQKDGFFDLCDELGLMVWQEFPLSCNYYEGEEYLRVLDQESRSIIRRLRSRACLALWCGGNELFNAWSGGGMTEQDHAMRLLNHNTYELDPSRPFMHTAPLYGMGHGCYVFALPDGTELFEYLPKRRFAAYSELGVPSPSPLETLERIIPNSEQFPPRRSPAWIARHGYNAWDGSPGSWLEFDFLQRYFGEFNDLAEIVEAGQWLQAQGLRFFFEEGRRQKPYCSLVMNWCLNENWPTAANSSLIAWPALPKPALNAVGLACRPVLASARPARLRWSPGELFCADLFILNDSYQALPAGTLDAFLHLEDRDIHLLTWDFQTGEANANIPGPQIRLPLDGIRGRRFELDLKVQGRPEWDSRYAFLLRS